MWLEEVVDAKTSTHSSSPLVGAQFSDLPPGMKSQQSYVGHAAI